MDGTVVIYASKYGATKRYAQWIAQELACDFIERSQAGPEVLKRYDTVIYGGGLYAGGVNGISLLTKHCDEIRGKRVVLFTCGLADPADPENVAHIRESLGQVLTGEMRDQIQVFHLRGGIDYAKLSLLHRSMMAMLCKLLRKKDYSALREEDKQMLETYGKKVDFTDRASIRPLIDYVNGEA